MTDPGRTGEQHAQTGVTAAYGHRTRALVNSLRALLLLYATHARVLPALTTTTAIAMGVSCLILTTDTDIQIGEHGDSQRFEADVIPDEYKLATKASSAITGKVPSIAPSTVGAR